MPSFAHLSNDEINVLRPYLDQLAGIRGAERQQRQIAAQPVRVGELIVKGTCHICHDATSNSARRPRRSMASSHRSPPSVNSRRKRRSPRSSARGLVPLHAGGQPARQGRMPVLGYLSNADIASVYAY